jgi:tetrapyrrole methylase family protein/MazG family protein
MEELLKKYASVILNSCLKVEKNQPLFISANYERVDFVKILANIAYEIGVKDIYFDLTDVINEECEKMIRRHPHIFLQEEVKTIDKALEKWENVKSKEHGEERYTDRLKRVPKALPALLRSSKVQGKASKVGFDWDDALGAFDKLEEEIKELRCAYEKGDAQNMTEEFGDLLFSMVNVSRFLDIDPEDALNQTTVKFINRFDIMERLASERGLDFAELSLEEMDKLWVEAKK